MWAIHKMNMGQVKPTFSTFYCVYSQDRLAGFADVLNSFRRKKTCAILHAFEWIRCERVDIAMQGLDNAHIPYAAL